MILEDFLKLALRSAYLNERAAMIGWFLHCLLARVKISVVGFVWNCVLIRPES